MAREDIFLPDDPDDPGDGGGGGYTPPPASSYGTLIFNQAINKVDGDSALDITCYLNLYSTDDLRYSAYLFIDDELIQVGTTNAGYDGNPSRASGTMTVVAIREGVSAGAHTVSLRIKNRASNYPLDVQAGSLIKVCELRQGAR
ncbi:hypothetical protein ASE73_02535 [Sphingomonas sp. Leaf24]|uniref:hypothetical protein n=1 Tax=unclassified Sphingomonas TaxID=196159 RepID=UPI0007021B59|nr:MULTISPECIES: hypothetical protein [unclassified Sphingomonas]KQM23120.1 hypothetical protein ASE50_02535 [Sphingomonas sp. Leaf5]KQM95978.1 hypothetical protein ASE73_02535 [Sphingomonas sp. Leaf24]